MLHLWAEKLNQDDGLFGAEEIGHHADYDQIELLNLVPRKYRQGFALHSGFDLGERENLRVCRKQRGGK